MNLDYELYDLERASKDAISILKDIRRKNINRPGKERLIEEIDRKIKALEDNEIQAK